MLTMGNSPWPSGWGTSLSLAPEGGREWRNWPAVGVIHIVSGHSCLPWVAWSSAPVLLRWQRSGAWMLWDVDSFGDRLDQAPRLCWGLAGLLLGQGGAASGLGLLTKTVDNVVGGGGGSAVNPVLMRVWLVLPAF